MGYFQVRYDTRVINYDHRGFIILATGPFLEVGALGSYVEKEGADRLGSQKSAQMNLPNIVLLSY